ncbi:MAG: class IV adenylate cyclase [Acidobacteria bacterium]|nr:class IV adenylate cyclase [Acidobacteriota bacterium]
MSDEIEKKYRLQAGQKDLLGAALTGLGAEYVGADFEENVLFLGHGLLEREAVLRLRRVGGATVVTYKQKIASDAGLKHHREYETTVEDFDEMAKIFEALGFHRSMVYEKRRRTWRFRDVEIVLDELPFGDFMEIEGPVAGIAEAEALLGAADYEGETKTYPLLTLDHGRRNGAVIEARFDE